MESSVPFVGPISILAFTKQYVADKAFREKININDHFLTNQVTILRSVSQTTPHRSSFLSSNLKLQIQSTY
jgi:hypothetical protein